MSAYQYTVSAHAVFCASVQIPEAEGPCQNPHGYTYQVKAHLMSKTLNVAGWSLDYQALDDALSEHCAMLDHIHLNDYLAFQTTTPSCEHIGQWLIKSLRQRLTLPHGTTLQIDLEPKPGCMISVKECLDTSE